MQKLRTKSRRQVSAQVNQFIHHVVSDAGRVEDRGYLGRQGERDACAKSDRDEREETEQKKREQGRVQVDRILEFKVTVRVVSMMLSCMTVIHRPQPAHGAVHHVTVRQILDH
jgi:hypothetical protein